MKHLTLLFWDTQARHYSTGTQGWSLQKPILVFLCFFSMTKRMTTTSPLMKIPLTTTPTRLLVTRNFPSTNSAATTTTAQSTPLLSPPVISDRKTRRTRRSILLPLRMMTRTTMMPPKFPCLPIPAIPPAPITTASRLREDQDHDDFVRDEHLASCISAFRRRNHRRRRSLSPSSVFQEGVVCFRMEDDDTITVHEECTANNNTNAKKKKKNRADFCSVDEMWCGKWIGSKHSESFWDILLWILVGATCHRTKRQLLLPQGK